VTDASWYIDTSALVKLIRAENETLALRAFLLTVGTLVSSALVMTEALQAARRADPDLVPFAEATVESLSTLVDLDRSLLRTAALVGSPGLRSLDAIHLATAQRLQPDLAGMITYDGRLAEAAEAAGLEVVSPGR
jgi:predicted nucleic acid-binding protein